MLTKVWCLIISGIALFSMGIMFWGLIRMWKNYKQTNKDWIIVLVGTVLLVFTVAIISFW